MDGGRAVSGDCAKLIGFLDGADSIEAASSSFDKFFIKPEQLAKGVLPKRWVGEDDG